MSFFGTILSAAGNAIAPDQAGELGAIAGAIDELSSNHGLDASTTSEIAGVVGKYVKTGLQETRNTSGDEGVAATIAQFAGVNPSTNAVSALLSGPQVEQVIAEIAQRTGLDRDLIDRLLPFFVPIVLKFLGLSGDTASAAGGSSLLNVFLDSDGDGDVDFSDALRLATQFGKR